jgi:hypothetical protein
MDHWPPAISELNWVPFERSPGQQCGAMRSLVDAHHHLIERDGCEPELYDRAADPDETENLAPRPEYRERISEMRAEMRRSLELRR